MKNYIRNNILKSFLILATSLFFIYSCEDYLDKAPESDITSEDIFKDFISFQGFVEDMYQNIVDIGNREIWGLATWNWGDDVVGTRLDGAFSDQGDYWWGAYNTEISPFYAGNNFNTGNDIRPQKGYWNNGWYGIRNANIALENVDECVSCTQEQKNLLAGQAYFFRAYFHFEILRAWGGIPYIDQVFLPADEMRLPRLTYQETAEKISSDLRRAAELLPTDWDNTESFSQYAGQNTMRITKGAALGVLGRNLLYAASPLMNGVSNGNYIFNNDLSKEAAAALWEVIKLADQGVYGLEPWENYSDNFYKNDRSVPHGKEIVFSNPVFGHSRWNFGSFMLNTHGGWGTYSGPTENYVEYFGMANGLPISEIDSEYDPTNPWDNRDPRFYYNILKNGDQLVNNFTSNVPEYDRYAQLYVGGRHRSAGNSLTGYGFTKFHRRGYNSYDQQYGNSPYFQVPKLRLADVYLMYAEAVNEVYGPTTRPDNIPNGMTAVEAVNIVRNRANVPGVDNRFVIDKNKFRDAIWSERAVELAFENHRWYDLRRWYVAHELQYRQKYIIEFDAEESYFEKKLYITKIFDMKHYWLPFQREQAALYPEFPQNPGW